MEELKDLNQQFEDRHSRALDLYRDGEYAAAIAEWQSVLNLCAGRPVQELSVISGIVEASVRLERYDDALRTVAELIRRKQGRGLTVSSGLLERLDYLRSFARTTPREQPRASSASKVPKPPASPMKSSSSPPTAARKERSGSQETKKSIARKEAGSASNSISTPKTDSSKRRKR